MLKHFTSLLLSLCLMVLFFPTLPAHAESTSLAARYTVLVLDTSGSMKGAAMTAQKQAALLFCESLLSSENENHIAVVQLNTSSTLGVNFTSDMDVLRTYINSLVAMGNTNFSSALQTAADALATVPGEEGEVIRNIVFCSDGIPESGATASNGPYTSSDNSAYRYANAAYNLAQTLKEHYNIYTLAFFHSLSASNRAFGERLMSDIQNDGAYVVDDPNELAFVFNSLAVQITQSQLRELFVEQHIAHYKNSYERSIMPIYAPNTDTRDSTDNIIGAVVEAAANDHLANGYNALHAIVGVLNTNLNPTSGINWDFFDTGDTTESCYRFMLADMISSANISDTMRETMQTVYMDSSVDMMEEMLKYGANNISAMAQYADVSTEVARQDFLELSANLQELSITTNPSKFASLYGKCEKAFIKYMDNRDVSRWLSRLAEPLNRVSKNLPVILPAIKGTVKTITEVISYYACYEAYCAASEMQVAVLRQIADASDSANFPDFSRSAKYCTALRKAANAFVNECDPAMLDPASIMERLVTLGTKAYVDSYADALINLLVDMIPCVGQLNVLRRGLGLTGSVTLIVVSVLTPINDIAYTAELVYAGSFLVNSARIAAGHFGSEIVGASDRFNAACAYDEAVRLWRTSMLMLCDMGVEYNETCLKAARRELWTLHLDPVINTAAKIAAVHNISWYSTAISLCAFERTLAGSVHCHDVNLSYDPITRAVDLSSNARVICIACPVTVTVTDAAGSKKAVLSNQVQSVSSGYEPYFHVVETEPGTGDYMKVCYIPDDWSISFSGTGEGEMMVICAEINSGSIYDEQCSDIIPVEPGMTGHIAKPGETGMVVIDYRPSLSLRIVLDQDVYKCNVGQPVTITADIYTTQPYEEGIHKYIGYFAYLKNGAWQQITAWYIDGGAVESVLTLTPHTWQNTGRNLFTISVFPVDNFAVGGSLQDYFFPIYVLPEYERVYVLPNELKTVDIAAFAGTNAQQITLPEGVTSIGSGAFMEMYDLYQLDVPASVSNITEDALSDSPNVTVVCPIDSYAARWAYDHGVPRIEYGKSAQLVANSVSDSSDIAVDAVQTALPWDTEDFLTDDSLMDSVVHRVIGQ